MQAALDQLSPLLDSISERIEKIAPESKGISLLSVKNIVLLQYLTSLICFISGKINGRFDESLVPLLVKYRVYLEKMKPLVQKLDYQITKLLKQQTEKTSYKPVPANFITENAPAEQSVYVAPKIAPVLYETRRQNTERKERKVQQKAQKSRMLMDIREEYDEKPTELDTMGTAYSKHHMSALTKEYQEGIDFEERNFIRKPVTKKQKSLMKRMEREQFKNELTEFADFGKLEELHQIADVETRKSKSVENSSELIQKLSNKRKSQGRDVFSMDRKAISKKQRKMD
jgi:hypothetical protein